MHKCISAQSVNKVRTPHHDDQLIHTIYLFVVRHTTHKSETARGHARRLAAGDGDAAGGERAAGVGAVDVAAVRRVARVLAEARLLRAQVGAARRRGRRPADDRRRAHRQLRRGALLRRRPARARRRHHDQRQRQRHEHRHRLRHGTCLVPLLGSLPYAL